MQNLTKKSHIPQQTGLVISYFGNSVSVLADNGQVIPCHLHRNQALPVVGDQVVWQSDGAEAATILSIQPRRSLLSRGDARGRMQALAANVDAMVIVMAPPPIFSEYLLDRYLVAAELLHISPILVLNKIDLLDEAKKQASEKRLAAYRRIPYPVVLTSAKTGQGLPEIMALLKGLSAVLVGPSGVGKSSIIMALGHDTRIPTNEVSAKGAGKHTTTATHLYLLPQGIRLIDSPGVREFNLWPVKAQEVLGGFKEFHAFLTGCKFRDCQHLAEPGCALKAAVDEGFISKDRLASYHALLKSAIHQEKW